MVVYPDSDGSTPAMSPPITPGHARTYLAGETQKPLSKEQKLNIAALFLMMIEALDFLKQKYSAKPAALARMIEINETRQVCYFRLMLKVPGNLKLYRNSYILVGEKLYYINPECICENVKITNFSAFRTQLDALNPGNANKISLSERQISSLIISNGEGHNYQSNLAGGRKTLEALLEVAKNFVGENRKHAGLFGPLRSDLFYRVCKVVAKLSLIDVSNETTYHLFNEFTKINPDLTSQRTRLLGLKREWRWDCGRFSCLYRTSVE
jgi:hypothetical protein